MRDVKPPVNFNKLEIDSIDSSRLSQHHYGHSRPAHRGVAALIILSIVILLVVGGLAGYMYLLGNNSDGQLSTTSGNQALLSNTLTAQALITKAKATVSGEVRQTVDDPSGSSYTVYSAPPFRPTGYNFSVRPDTEYGFGSYGTQNTVSADMIFIQKVLVDNGLSEKVLNAGNADGGFTASYESDSIVCQLNDQKPLQQSKTASNYGLSIGCANTADYQTNAALLRPYFIVYASQARTDTTKVLMSSLTLKASQSAGYSTATVSISGSAYGSVGGFAGLFYITPDMTLHYFTATQSELSCRQYATDELKKAYLGEQCYDEASGNQRSTVRL